MYGAVIQKKWQKARRDSIFSTPTTIHLQVSLAITPRLIGAKLQAKISDEGEQACCFASLMLKPLLCFFIRKLAFFQPQKGKHSTN